MLKEAILWEQLGDSKAKCGVCSFRCVIPDGGLGHCRTRKNFDGKIYSLIYGTVTSDAVDPIEKKPLYHFLPGSKSYSMGSVGCNFRCEHCQNWTISQGDIESVYSADIMPEQAVEIAKRTGSKSVSFTYNEPGIWVEFARDTSTLCHESGLKTVYVTNGYPTPEHMDVMKGLLDAFRVDIKSFSEDFYKKVCKAKLAPVLESTKIAKEYGMHVEVVTLVIPGMNDSAEELTALSKWVNDEIGPDTPIHFTRFHPMHKMLDQASTPLATLEKAYDIAKDAGLRYVYLGNVPGNKHEDTWCPGCGNLLIKRAGFGVVSNVITKEKKCPGCGEHIAVVF